MTILYEISTRMHENIYGRNAGIQNFSDFRGDYFEIREGSV